VSDVDANIATVRKFGRTHVPDGRKIKKVVIGYATVFFCDPEHYSGIEGCGLFMFFKPEVKRPSYKCPNCSAVDAWTEIEDELAAIEVVKL